MKEKSKHTGLWIIIYVIAALGILMLVTGSYKNGINLENSDIETSTSLEEIKKKTAIEIDIPQGIDTSTIREANSLMGQLIEIRADHYILKIAAFIDVNADVLGLYEKSNIESYSVSANESGINFVRYRTNYPEYEDCTLVNWCTPTTSYGIMLDSVITLDEALNMLGISKDNITEYYWETDTVDEKEIVTIENNINFVEYSFNNNTMSLLLPELESQLEIVDMEDYSVVLLNGEQVLAILYTDYAIQQDFFSGQGDITLTEWTRLRYLLKNKFELGTNEYNDYEIILKNIYNIATSIQ